MGDLDVAVVVLAAPGAPRFPLNQSEIGVGRTSDNAMRIDHPELSRHHARFLKQGNEIVLQDLNSRNGTFVNGKRIEGTVLLRNLDRIEFAGIAMVFHAPSDQRRAPGRTPDVASPLIQSKAAPNPRPLPGEEPPMPRPGAVAPSANPVDSPPPSGTSAPGQIDSTSRIPPPPAARSPLTDESEGPSAPQAALEAGEAGPPVLLLHNEMRIGRLSGNDLVLADPQVSARHAVVQHQNGRFLIFDLGSTNGTYVNGRRIEHPHELQPGDEIRMGERIYFFRRLAPAPRAPSSG